MMFVLALAIACVAWTVTQEEVFRELREWFKSQNTTHPNAFIRKLAYMPTCHYCFSHWVTFGVLILTHYKLLYPDFRGYLVSEFALVYLANFYMTGYAILRQVLKRLTQIGNLGDNQSGGANAKPSAIPAELSRFTIFYPGSAVDSGQPKR